MTYQRIVVLEYYGSLVPLSHKPRETLLNKIQINFKWRNYQLTFITILQRIWIIYLWHHFPRVRNIFIVFCPLKLCGKTDLICIFLWIASRLIVWIGKRNLLENSNYANLGKTIRIFMKNLP